MTEMERKLLDALKGFVSHGCPVCSGDCASANPPVTFCPMTSAQALIAEAEALRHSPVAEVSDGWIPWAGGECPLKRGTIHQVRFRDGFESDPDGCPQGWHWRHDGNPADIIAYRVVGEPK